MTDRRPPFGRAMPAWLAVSLLVHAAVFAGAALLPEEPESPARPMQVVVAGTVAPPQPVADASSPDTPPPKIDSPRMSEPPPPRPRRARAERPTRRPQRTRTTEPDRAEAPAAAPETAQPTDEPMGGDRLAAMQPGTSASAPRMGRPGEAFDGPLAGGGAKPLTRGAHAPAGFAVTAPGSAGGVGPGLGGSGSGLGAGGSAGGIGGGGTPGGSGPGSGGEGGSSEGYVASRGTVGSGPGMGSGTSAPPVRSVPPATRPAPQPQPEPKPEPEPAPQPEPQREPPPAPEPQPKPEPPGPSQADLSRFRSLVQSRINGAKRYPSSARQQGQEGTVRVSFSVAPSGRPTGISLAGSSGCQALDAAARRAVGRAAPYRPFPKGMTSSIHVTATVVFRLQ